MSGGGPGDKSEFHQRTQVVRSGLECDDTTGAVVPPIHLTSTFAFRGFGDKRAYDYTRSGNPTRDLLACALAELEEGVGAVVTSTGMSAITLVGYLIPAGSRIVAPHDCYGGTYRLFNAWNQRGERKVEFVNFNDDAAVREALSKPAALLWIETPSNPLLRITDIEKVAALGKAAGALVVVDNTFLSPAWQQPLKLGADLVLHSTTKYLNGHSDVVGGAVVAKDKALHDQLIWWANCLGITGAPFDSFLTLRGLRTLHVRLDAHGKNALGLAQWLQHQPEESVLPGRAHAPRLRCRAPSAKRVRSDRHARNRGRSRWGARVRRRAAVLLAGRVARRRREPRGSPGDHDACGDGRGGASDRRPCRRLAAFVGGYRSSGRPAGGYRRRPQARRGGAAEAHARSGCGHCRLIFC
jgi:cystathionine gamma-synthase